MKKFLPTLISLTSLFLLAPVDHLSAADAAGSETGFKPLFNGKDLAGWDGNPKLWSAKAGVIAGQTTPENPLKGNTFLIWTNGQVSDFELRCSFRITANNDKGFANSGVQYRSKILDPANWVVGGYQADMEAGRTYTGILYEERMTRGIMAARGEKVNWDKDCKKQVVGSLGTSEELQAAIKQGDWNEYVIIAKGNHFQHFVNGKQTVDVTDDCEEKRAMKGVLALQLHAGQPMTVEFKNLRLRELSSGGSASANPFDGDWQVTAIEAGGNKVPTEDATNMLVKIDGDSYKVSSPFMDSAGKFSVDTNTQPKHIDLVPGRGSGPDEGHTLPGIYEVNGDTMRVCYSRTAGHRPSAFDTSDDANAIMLTYKRKP